MWCHVAKHNGATPFMFDSRNTGNCQSSAQSNRSDANVMELNIITTFMFDSRGAGNLQSIAQSNLLDAKRNGIMTFMFDSRTHEIWSRCAELPIGCKT